MIQMFHLNSIKTGKISSRDVLGGTEMHLTKSQIIILIVIAIIAFLLGRLAVRAFFNLLMGGTLFGGNFL